MWDRIFALVDRALDFVEWIGGHGWVVLAAVLLIVAGVWGFVELADEVTEGDTQTFDERVVRAMRRADDPATPIGPRYVQEMGRDATALGGTLVLMLATGGVIGYLLMVRKYHAAGAMAVAVIGGWVISSTLKYSFERDRPDIVPHLSHVHTPSFPSGHALNSAVVYMTLGTFLARLVQGRKVKIYFIAIAMLLTFLTGVSRVYLGVHYPTDVLAGWTAGLCWAMLCWVVARVLQKRGTIEKDTEKTVRGQHVPESADVAGVEAQGT